MRRATAVPPRYRCAPPAQQRSRETMDRFAQAAEELLKDRPFEAISIQDIARHAGRPVGSFYARFGSKDALLPFLYERFHVGLEPLVEARLARIDWDGLDFTATVRGIVDIVMGLYDERRWLMRTLSVFARTRPEAMPAELVRQRARVFEHPARILARHADRIAHDDVEAACVFGLYLVSTVAREKLVFGEVPLSRIVGLSRRALRDELVRTLHSYLTGEKPR
jgi:AcrR family transcriptional regulator